MHNFLIWKGLTSFDFGALKWLNFKMKLIIRDHSVHTYIALTYLRTECYDLWGGISDHLDTIFMIRHRAGQICNLNEFTGMVSENLTKFFNLKKEFKQIIFPQIFFFEYFRKITSFSWPSLAAAKSINNGVSGSRKLSDTWSTTALRNCRLKKNWKKHCQVEVGIIFSC